MQQLTEKHGPYEVVERLENLAAALGADPRTEHLQAGIEAAIDEIEASHKIWRRLRSRRVAATGRLWYADEQLREPFMKLARHVATETDGKREAPESKTLYPGKPASELIKPLGGDDQAREVRRVVDRLRTDPVVAAFAHHADPIEQAQARVEAEEARRADIDLEVSKARLTMDRALDAARRLYNATESDLLETLGHDRKAVRAFYA